MAEQENREKTIYAQYRDEINQMYDDIVNNGCPISADNFKVCHYVRDAGYRKEEEVRKECDKNAYNAWKAMFGLKEKTIREEVRKETIEEILRFIEMEHYSSAMVTLIEDIKTKFLGWKHPMSVEVEDND